MKERHTRTLFVRNLPFEYTEEELKRMFEKFGEVKKSYLLSGDKKGMAFVTYVSINLLSHSISFLHFFPAFFDGQYEADTFSFLL